MKMFEVNEEDISKLSDEDLRSLIGRLCELEAINTCGSVVGVTYGGNQTAPDGGIDVRAELSKSSDYSFLPRRKTGLQVKAEDFPRNKIIKEMRPHGVLRASIVDLIENSGSYIIVSSQGSVADSSLKNRRNAIVEAVQDHPDHTQLHTDFYDRQRIATWVNQYPSLVPWVREKTSFPLNGWQPFKDWSSSPDDADAEYIIDDTVRLTGVRLKDARPLKLVDGLNTIRKILDEAGGTVRLVGLSGVGKTRFIQALFDARVGNDALNKNYAVYTDISDSPSPLPQDLLTYLIQTDQRCILIIDNCGVDLHKKLAKQLKQNSGNVSLITIEYDISDDEPEFTDTFKLEPSSKEIIEKIISIKFPILNQQEVRTIAKFSEGNSRVALALASSAQHGNSVAW